MLGHGARPRELHWYHAGPMLFGDWGTSRLYVLGLAFFYARHASIYFMLAMSVLLVSVGWAYQVICRLYPEGGGVYSSARQRSQLLAVVGALLLCADYVVTAALSSLDAFHYLRMPHAHLWAAGSIVAVGMLNYFGPTKAGTGALVVALLTIALSAAIGLAAAPALPHAHIEAPTGEPIEWWRQFTALILAISGVEAIANMTGIMVKPVERTARRAIWPVLIEIVVLNIVLTLAMLAVPHEVLGNGDAAHAFTAHRDDMLRLLAEYYIGHVFAAIASFVFALLLLSAVNTAVTDLVSIQFMMSRDGELPPLFGGLNRWGMPVAPLVLGTVVPTITVLCVPDVGHLADLYAIGVVGAVAVNLGSCSTNVGIALRPYERVAMFCLAVLMVAIWITIAIQKPWALAFAMSIMAFGLAGRWVARNRAAVRQWFLAPVPTVYSAALPPGVAPAAVVATNLLAVPSQAAKTVRIKEPARQSTKRLLMATRGNPRLVDFAIEQARTQQAELLVLFVRHVAVPTIGTGHLADASGDAEAQELFAKIRQQAEPAGVAVWFLYAVGWDVADTILEMAATYGVDALLLGSTQRTSLWRTMKGDVLQQVAEFLPERINLLIHA